MTVTALPRAVYYTGDGVSTSFDVPFQFFEVDVYVAGELVETTSYTTSQAAPGLMGSVVFSVAPADGVSVLIDGNTEIIQEADYVEQDPFPAATHERSLDRLTMAVQELDQKVTGDIDTPAVSPDFALTASPDAYVVTIVDGKAYQTPLANVLSLNNISPIGRTLNVGDVVPHVFAEVPAGWIRLKSTTQSVAKALYPEYAAKCEAEGYPYGSTATHVNVPAISAFIRAWDNVTPMDPDSATRLANGSASVAGNVIGSRQLNQNKSHSHERGAYTFEGGNVAFRKSNSTVLPAGGGAGGGPATVQTGSGNTSEPVTGTVTGGALTNSGGNEARPDNVAFPYIMLLSPGDAAAPHSVLGLPYNFDDATADANPASGALRINNATYGDATTIYISKTQAFGADVADYLLQYNATTAPTRGYLAIYAVANLGVCVIATVTGNIEEDTDYLKIPVDILSVGLDDFVDGSRLSVQVVPAGALNTTIEAAILACEGFANDAQNAAIDAGTAKDAAETAQSAAEAAQSAAETAETNAETAKTGAETAETNAEAARDAAIAAAAAAASSADAFDDVYLGSKASDPTLDNDGNALVEGQLYWNSTSNALMIYDGAVWLSYNPSAGGSGGGVELYATRTALKAATTATTKYAVLQEGERRGTFVLEAGDFSADVAADPGEGVFLEADDTPASTAVWRRDIRANSVSPKMFGAVRGTVAAYDPDNPAVLSSNQAIQRCWDWAAANKAKVIMDDEFHGGNHLALPSGLDCRWDEGAWLYQTESPSIYGGFVMARDGGIITALRRNIHLTNPQIDGQLYPAPKQFTIQSGATTTVFNLDASASAVDGSYVGLFAYLIDGTAGINGASVALITGYVGSTRQVTLATALNVTPANGTTVRLGYNDLAIGFGCHDSTINGFHIRNYPASAHIPYVNGGKAINTEQGSSGLYISGGLIDNCGHGVYVQGISWQSATVPDWHRVFPSSGIAAITTGGTSSVQIQSSGASGVDDAYVGCYAYIYTGTGTTTVWNYRRKIVAYNAATRTVTFDVPLPVAATTSNGIAIGVSKRCSLNTITDIRVKNSGSVATVRGMEFHNPDSFDNMTVISNINAENCGHVPGRVVGTGQQKSGCIVLSGTANAKISNVQIRNDDSYPNLSPGYAGLSQYQVGYGLSGNVGAILWGTAVNTEVKNVSYHGDCDAMIVVNRARAMGRDNTPTGALRYDIDGLYHYGACNFVIATGTEAGATDASPSDANLTGDWRNIKPGTVNTKFVDDSGIGYTNVMVEIVNPTTQRRHVGKMVDLNALATFAGAQGAIADVNYHGRSVAAAQFKSYEFTLNDNNFATITPPKTAGIMAVSIFAGAAQDLVKYRVGASPVGEVGAVFTTASAAVVAGTGALTAGTGDGTDGKLNIFTHTDGLIYVKNMLGNTQTPTITFIA